MDSERLRMLVHAPVPFVSLLIDDSHDTHDAEEQATVRWAAVRRRLEDSGIADHVIGAVERAVLRGRPGVGRRGRAIIAGAEGVLINESLDTPPVVTVLRVSQYPYVLPLLGHGAFRTPYLFAAVDHLGADITWHREGAMGHQTVEGGGFPVHKPATAGWQGYGDLQHTTDEAVRMNSRTVAVHLTEAVDRTAAEVVFVSGEVRSRNDVMSELPAYVAERVVELPARAQGGRAAERDFASAIAEEFERRRLEATTLVLARFDSELGRGSGLAVTGMPAVCAALRDGAVDTLILGDLGGSTVVAGDDRTVIASDADTLSELGEAPRFVAPADEALPFAAFATNAAVVCLQGETGLDEGVAALLRYAPASSAGRDHASRALAPQRASRVQRP